MKSLFRGKRKLLSIPLVAMLGIAFFPFFIAGIIGWFAYKKIGNTKIRYSVLAVTALFALFFGSAWTVAMVSPSSAKPTPTPSAQTQPVSAKVDFNDSQATKPIEATQAPTVFKAQTAPNNPNLVLAKVVKVIDGDTIEVDLGEGNIKTIRYIGIDTPETVDPRQAVQCFGKEASAKNKELVGNGIVGLEKDVSETDRYGRLLRYVYMGDLFINQLLVAEGYARSSSYPPDVKHQNKLRQAEQQARNADKGLWGTCNTATAKPTVKPTTKPVTQQQPTAPPAQARPFTNTGGKSCSGVDYDCSDFSSHAEAQAFFNSCGFTAENDPMKLDSVGVGDGVACESL